MFHIWMLKLADPGNTSSARKQLLSDRPGLYKSTGIPGTIMLIRKEFFIFTAILWTHYISEEMCCMNFHVSYGHAMNSAKFCQNAKGLNFLLCTSAYNCHQYQMGSSFFK